jgi:hypothetical protein
MHRALLIVALACAAAAPASAQSQWTTTGTDIQNNNTGYVGVNIAPWRGQLHVASANNNGIWGETTLSYAAGVTGYNSNTSATGPAVFGWNLGTSGKGVYGYAAATTGGPTGVWGESVSSGGYGVVGINSSAAGGIALYARSVNSAGYSVYSLDGMNYLGGNTGIGTASPTAKLHVHGSVKLDSIGSLTTGTANLAAIDSTGNVVQQAPPFGNAIAEYRSNATWVVPAGVTRVHFKMWGGGGGGYSSTPFYGGGSGAYIEGILNVAANGSGNSLSINVGVGGAVAGTGGATTIVNGATTLVSAGGGSGGTFSGTGVGGTANNYVSGSTFIVKNGLPGTGTSTNPPYPGPAEIITNPIPTPSTLMVSVGSGGVAGYTGANGAVILQW